MALFVLFSYFILLVLFSVTRARLSWHNAFQSTLN